MSGGRLNGSNGIRTRTVRKAMGIASDETLRIAERLLDNKGDREERYRRARAAVPVTLATLKFMKGTDT